MDHRYPSISIDIHRYPSGEGSTSSIFWVCFETWKSQPLILHGTDGPMDGTELGRFFWMDQLDRHILRCMDGLMDGYLAGSHQHRWICRNIVDAMDTERERWDEMRWDEIRWDEMRLDEMRWDEMKWDGMGLDWIGWNEMRWDEMRWDESTASSRKK